MMDDSLLFFLIAGIAAFLVGASKGGLPMVGVLGVPLLALVMPPVAAAALLLPVYIVSDWVGLWAYRREYSGRNLAILLPAMIFGVAVGWATAKITPEWMVTLLVGVVGLYYCATVVLRKADAPPRPADIPRGVFWGALTGFTSFVSHTGGPPFQTYVLPQKLPKMVFAGTSTIAFAVINVVKLLPYWALGQFNPGNLEVAAMLSPVAILGAVVGYKGTRLLPETLFYRLVEVALFVVSLKLVYDALFK
ncbi:sulfite exporter TauE/SafE family protein [Aestuariivirga sp.]|uniref:sulfite exporter TauE/SafE family protein n=1 Tax=Aestuariivirga sp. TaxID=2650926 RepID=UPI0025BD053B|nr:sulfite exporter TauE/SafE family protein [Aestuariivirga sp.]MCA3556442.1 sulfite exporter TauE/SafE family protein [Aestuariivirga sp.]